MKVMLTSCGIETEKIKECFLQMLEKNPAEATVLFIPTAAIDADAIDVLPKCMNDLLKCGIPKENIRVFDLHRDMPSSELESFDLVYICGGSTSYLLQRINDSGFRSSLLAYIRNGGLVLGVSAGSLIFADNLPDNLHLLGARMAVHCKSSNIAGRIHLPPKTDIQLSNTAAMLIRTLPDDVEIIDEAACPPQH